MLICYLVFVQNLLSEMAQIAKNTPNNIMQSEIVFAVAILSFIGTIIFLIKLIYHSTIMFRNVKNEKASFLGPFILFFPSVFNEIGQKHWRAFPPTFFACAVFSIFMAMCFAYLEGKFS
tara:strand:- start:46 stop:402 length:357 start_codon:yes stop_codon:yes gene_type:complete